MENRDDCRWPVSWPARRLLLVIRYFEWQGRFFYRRSHLNAKYYSNGTGFLSHPFALSQRLLFSCPLLLFLVLFALFPAHPFFSLSFTFVFLFPPVSFVRFDIPCLTFSPLFLFAAAVRTQAETPLGQEASFPDIQMRSNIIPGYRAPHGGGAAPRFPRG